MQMDSPTRKFSPEQLAWQQRVVEIARSWVGTPYHHQASLKGVGTDCFGLVRGVWRELYGLPEDPEKMPAYSWDWAEAQDDETMLNAARRHLDEVPIVESGAGDVVIFRYRDAYNAKHSAILTGGGRMIHAAAGASACEVHMGSWWERRRAGTFAFPMTLR